MYARMSRLESGPDRVEEGIRTINEDVIPNVRGMPGFKGASFMADRRSGTLIAVTFWASEEELESSREAVKPLRKRAADATGAKVAAVEEFEVVAQA